LRKGWIPQVIHLEETRNYAFVHLDVDLYEPTLTSLQYFFPLLSPGGVIVCDDYGASEFPGASSAFDHFLTTLPPDQYTLFMPLSTGGCFLVK